MSEPIKQARVISDKPFIAKMPECLRDTAQREKPSNPAPAKTVTALDVLAEIREQGPCSRAELAQILDVKPAGLIMPINRLLTSRVIQKTNAGYEAIKHPKHEELPDDVLVPSSPTRSLDEPTDHLFDAELTAALELITTRVKQTAGIKPLPKDDHRVVAFSRLVPMLSDDLAEAVSEILDYVTGE